jgi:uncharacterized metal-binding protein
MKCAPCDEKECSQGKDCTGSKQDIKSKYSTEDLMMMKVADKLTEKYYMKKTRIEEVIYFAKEMKYQKLGMAFCIGLRQEAEILDKILSKEFKVFSANCKICGIKKSEMRAKTKAKDKKIQISCNPVGQAEILNQKNTDLNINLGLCLGHDILFTEHSQAPVTTLAVKDRVLGHNPLAAVYSRFYRLKRFNLDK